MALLTLAEARLSVSVAVAGDDLLQRWLDAAEESIDTRYWVVGRERQAIWRSVSYAELLQFDEPVETLGATEVDGQAVSAVLDGGTYALRRADGGLWFGRVVTARYMPQPFLAIRKEMQRQLLLGYAARSGYSTQSISGVVVTPDVAYENRVLRMMPQPWFITEDLPSETIDAPGGE